MKNIVLVGFMGTGKTQVGNKLAAKLKRKFIDLDHLIEAQAGMTIPEIFSQYGEPKFRQLETEIIGKIANASNAVIATGGGAIINPENLKNLQKNGLLFCLWAEPEVVAKRTRNVALRPLLKNATNTLQRIKELLNKRKPYYEQADFKIDTSNISVNQTVEKIMEIINQLENNIITVNLQERSYKIYIQPGSLNKTGEILQNYDLSKKVVIITSPQIKQLYGTIVSSSLKKAGLQVRMALVPAGERYKSLNQARRLYDFLIEFEMDRNATIIALGGGVIGDLAGFVAATYMRGINLVQIPTTLLAQVDSAIGGKTGVNHPRGKNLIGAFYQPKAVIIDPQTLQTLPKRELRAAFAEIVKYGVIANATFFQYLEEQAPRIISQHGQPLNHIIKKCAQIKAKIVEQDEREAGLRAILNYGHTIGHAVEATTDYRKLRHGEAVSIGMTIAAKIACQMKICQQTLLKRQTQLLQTLRLPITLPPLQPQKISQALKLDKKVRAGKVRFILPQKIGQVIITDEVPLTLVEEILTQDLPNP